MRLFLHLFIHLFFSLLAGFIVYLIYKNLILSFIPAVIVGVFIDIDHLFDYVFAMGSVINFKYFLKGYHFLISDKIIVPFHGWEYSVVSLLIFLLSDEKEMKIVALAISLSLIFHLTVDVYTNNILFKSYSTLYRISKRFKLKELVPPEHYQKHIKIKKQMGF